MEEILINLRPAIRVIFVLIMIFGLAQSLLKKGYKEIPTQLIIYGIILYVIEKPNQLYTFGEKMVEGIFYLVNTIGGSV